MKQLLNSRRNFKKVFSDRRIFRALFGAQEDQTMMRNLSSAWWLRLRVRTMGWWW
jgi:hypothetical protein